jgi:FkbM family methyltransferase
MYMKMTFFKRKVRGLAYRILSYIENNGNCDFDVNGERKFVKNLFDKFNESKQKRVIFDVGANTGDYAQILETNSVKFKVDVELHLFEPVKSSFIELSKKLNDKKHAFLNNCGASNTDDVAKIYYNKEGSSLASLYQRNLKNYDLQLDKSEEIKLIRLDRYIQDCDIKHIDFVKIDIEGHELKAFEGFGKYMHSDFIDYIQFEYGGANLDSRTSLMEIYSFFANNGFKIAKVMPNGLELREYSPFMDGFNYANYVAISKRLV